MPKRKLLSVQDVAAHSLDMGRCGWCFGTQGEDERWNHSGDCPLAPIIDRVQAEHDRLEQEAAQDT